MFIEMTINKDTLSSVGDIEMPQTEISVIASYSLGNYCTLLHCPG